MYIRVSEKLNFFSITWLILLTFSFNVIAIPYPHQSQRLDSNSKLNSKPTNRFLQKRGLLATAYLTTDFINQFLERHEEIHQTEENQNKKLNEDLQNQNKNDHDSNLESIEKELRSDCLHGIDHITGKCI
ncbi:secreted protein [Melampsora americana]|nr:secreted protein [Melampsora americana]